MAVSVCQQSLTKENRRMIDYITGGLSELIPTRAVVEANGVGYELNISLSTFSALEGRDEAKLFVYENIREDAWVLYGFATKQERELFLHLISVSGVGGNTACTVLSSYSVAELCAIITNRQDAMLKKIKGIGGKTAQRIIVELEDKLRSSNLLAAGTAVLPSSDDRQGGVMTQEGEEAVAALTMLGFSPAPSKKAVKQLLEQDRALNAETIVKMALKMM